MSRYLSSSLFFLILALMGFGLVQVYSSSFVFATETHGDGLYFFKRQLLFSGIGISVLIFTIHIPFEILQRHGWTLWLLAICSIVATFIPGLGVRVGGAYRWLQMPFGLRFEPGEFLKVCLSLMLASLLCKSKTSLARVPSYLSGLLFLIPVCLLLIQPDFGTFTIIILVSFFILFSFGLPWKWLVPLGTVSLPIFYFLVMTVPYRKARILGFLDPWSDPAKKGFQVIQSMLSFHSGGLTGVGLGQGQTKLLFLPEAHTDFTLAVFGEEAGFAGLTVLFLIYGFVVIKGLQISLRTQDKFRRVVALSASFTMAFTVFINAGVAMGLLPTKGLTLPFLSYGGSSLVVLCFMYGLVLNIENET